MPTTFDTFSNWARRTTSSFGELLLPPARSEPGEEVGDGLVYRLKHWPDLPCPARTAAVLRTLSVMSQRGVNRRWIMVTSKLSQGDVDALLQRLIRQDAVTITDTAIFPGATNADHLRDRAGAVA